MGWRLGATSGLKSRGEGDGQVGDGDGEGWGPASICEPNGQAHFIKTVEDLHEALAGVGCVRSATSCEFLPMQGGAQTGRR